MIYALRCFYLKNIDALNCSNIIAISEIRRARMLEPDAWLKCQFWVLLAVLTSYDLSKCPKLSACLSSTTKWSWCPFSQIE
jgi:hypothetical protein